MERVITAEIEYRIPFLDRCGATLCIMDTAGGYSQASEAATRMADLCLNPARPIPADIAATAPTPACIRAHGGLFAFVLDQTPVRNHRLNNAAAALSDTAASLNAMGVLALP